MSGQHIINSPDCLGGYALSRKFGQDFTPRHSPIPRLNAFTKPVAWRPSTICCVGKGPKQPTGRVEPDGEACYLLPGTRGALRLQPSRRRRACNTDATTLAHCPEIGKAPGKRCGAFPVLWLRCLHPAGPVGAGAAPINNLVLLGETLGANPQTHCRCTRRRTQFLPAVPNIAAPAVNHDRGLPVRQSGQGWGRGDGFIVTGIKPGCLQPGT
jgi:hypothetical protein